MLASASRALHVQEAVDWQWVLTPNLHAYIELAVERLLGHVQSIEPTFQEGGVP